MSIAVELKIFKFLIGQGVHDDIWYFSYKIRKGQILSQAKKDKRKNHAAKLFNKLNDSLQPIFFCQTRKISARIV